MKQELPSQLKHPDFRFALIPRNKKSPPIEQLWNSINNYHFFEPKLIDHILKGNNVQVITGFKNLIVIDFDDADFQKEKENLLPLTFTCRTAGKGLKHFYYTLQGEMIKKIGIDIDNKRVCDIQADRCGIICPPSIINRKSYDVIEDEPIAEIELKTLKRIFNLNDCKKPCDKKFEDKPNPKAVQEVLDLFKKLGIPRNGDRHYFKNTLLINYCIHHFWCAVGYETFEGFQCHSISKKIVESLGLGTTCPIPISFGRL